MHYLTCLSIAAMLLHASADEIGAVSQSQDAACSANDKCVAHSLMQTKRSLAGSGAGSLAEDVTSGAEGEGSSSDDDYDTMDYCRPYEVDRRRRAGSCSCRRRWSSWGWDGEYKCDGNTMLKKRVPTPSPTIHGDAEEDLLTVMTYNTYLLHVQVLVDIDVRPNLDERANLTAKWFNTLQPAEVPDVLVLQEIYSAQAENMMREICNTIWTKNSEVVGDHAHAPYIPCDAPNSPFGYATRCLNPTSSLNPIKTGGVVVLVKKGIEIDGPVDDVQFEGCVGEHCFTDIGFWAVKLKKGSQPYVFIGTHATAYEAYAERREEEFQQIRDYMNNHTAEGDRVVIAGDMNVFTNDYKDKDNNTIHPTEVSTMLNILGGPNAPATVGTNVPDGFWLKLDSPMTDSCIPEANHFLAVIDDEIRLGPQRYDWILAPGPGDSLATPVEMRWQIVPVQADTCYKTEDARHPANTMTDELSDHYGIFAAIRWTEDAADYTTEVQGHTGHSGSLPSGPTC